jgi:hypothetical protein
MFEELEKKSLRKDENTFDELVKNHKQDENMQIRPK